MHYYQFNIGDYRSSTAHLSNDEDLAYRRLLDMYYDSENKIPLDTQWVAKRLRLEPHVLRDVLNDMFVKHEDGWFHAKCDELIQQYQAMAEKNRANGRLGGRKKNPVGSQVDADWQPSAKATNNYKPITNNHKPNTKTVAVKRPEDVDQDVWDDFLAIRKAKRAVLTQTALDGIQREAGKAGWSLNDAIRETVSRGWQSFKADWVANSQNKPTETAYQKTQREAMEGLAPGVARKAPFNPNIFEAENVTFIEGR
jgi:uncharacterized protein YdaU (DUF1376 family)